MSRFYYDVILGLQFWSFTTPIEYNYAIDKNKWVTYKANKPAIKLRRYIHIKAEKLSRISMAQTLVLKRIFIEAYNLEGLNGVDRVYSEAVKRVVGSLKN